MGQICEMRIRYILRILSILSRMNWKGLPLVPALSSQLCYSLLQKLLGGSAIENWQSFLMLFKKI